MGSWLGLRECLPGDREGIRGIAGDRVQPDPYRIADAGSPGLLYGLLLVFLLLRTACSLYIGFA